eukprot:7382292-Prymnesium_polylepis.1
MSEEEEEEEEDLRARLRAIGSPKMLRVLRAQPPRPGERKQLPYSKPKHSHCGRHRGVSRGARPNALQ